MIDYLEKKFEKIDAGPIFAEDYIKLSREIREYCDIHNIPTGCTLADTCYMDRKLVAFGYYDVENNQVCNHIAEVSLTEIEDEAEDD